MKIVLEEVKPGIKTLKVNGVYLHSRYNPINEAKRFVSDNYKPANVQILIGYANGYIYEELLQTKKDNEKIIVIEPIDEIQMDVEVGWYFETSYQLRKELDRVLSVENKVNIIISINYEKIVKDKVLNILKIIGEKVDSNNVVENTFAAFSETWNENYIRNLKFSNKDQPLNRLFNKYSAPVIVASGGPSLMDSLEILSKYRENVILIAAGTTINSLLEHNIIPDYVISVDGGEINYKNFEIMTHPNIPIIYCPTQHYKIRGIFEKGYTFIHHYEQHFKRHYEKYSEKEVTIIQGGASVANAALNIAGLISTGPIALIGQDLSYTDGYTHAQGNYNRKKIDEQFKVNRGVVEKEGNLNSKVLTDTVFLQMKDCFNSIVLNYNLADRVFNCTNRGLKIEEIPFKSLNEFLTNFATISIIKTEDIINDVMNEEYKEYMLHDLTTAIYLKEKLFEAIKLLKANENKDKYDLNVLNDLNHIDEKLVELINELGLLKAFSYVNLRAVKHYNPDYFTDKIEKFNESYKQSYYLYSEMLKITERTIDIYKEEMELKYYE